MRLKRPFCKNLAKWREALLNLKQYYWVNQIRKVLTLDILNTISTEKSGITPFSKNRLHMSVVLSGRKERLSQMSI